MACKLCERNEPRPNGLCTTCMTDLGVIEMPPARRLATPCLKCNGMKFVRVIPREYTVTHGGDWNTPEVVPMTLTQEPHVAARLLFAGNIVHPSKLKEDSGYGVPEAYTCLACGFVEWYVGHPAEIPIGPEYMSELIDYGSATPYR
ncbi:MAG: hypothetical protein ABI175_03940 [Polyangiales bacterium]